jgi:hypothetical protein
METTNFQKRYFSDMIEGENRSPAKHSTSRERPTKGPGKGLTRFNLFR